MSSCVFFFFLIVFFVSVYPYMFYNAFLRFEEKKVVVADLVVKKGEKTKEYKFPLSNWSTYI